MKIENNKVALIHFTSHDENGNQVDESGDEPLAYLHGHNNLTPTLEKALEGKEVGAKFSCTIPAAEAFGEFDESLIQSGVPKSAFPGVDKLEVGMRFEAQAGEQVVLVTITAVDEETVTVDGNHELAGVDLAFEVEVADIRDATAEELEHGRAKVAEKTSCCSSSDCCSSDGCSS